MKFVLCIEIRYKKNVMTAGSSAENRDQTFSIMLEDNAEMSEEWTSIVVYLSFPSAQNHQE